MQTEARALLASLLLHVFLVGGAVGLVSLVPPQATPLLVDFSVEPGPPGTGEGGQKDELGGSAPGPVDTESTSENRLDRGETPAALDIAVQAADSSSSSQVMPTPRPKRVPRKPARRKTARPAAVVRPTQAVLQADGGGGSTSAGLLDGSGNGMGSGNAAGGVGGSAAGAGPGGGSETLNARYLREHFAYIRELIRRQLRYPSAALRSGWSGRVVASFTVQESGEIRDLRVEQSCGIGLLDRDAMETVRRAAPFPKPPASARLVVPVDYILE